MERVHAAVKCRVVVLASGGYADELRLYVLRDHAYLFERKLASGEAGEGGSGGYHERGRAGDSSACWRFRMCLQGEAGFGRKEADQVRGERVRKLLRAAEFFNAGEGIELPRVQRLQLDAAAGSFSDLAAGEDTHAEVHRDRAGMKEVEGPNV